MGHQLIPPKEWMDTLGLGATVMILDTGVTESCWLRIKSIRLFGEAPPADPSGHGTQVAHTVNSDNPVQLGIAPKADLYCGKCIDRKCTGWDVFYDALDWAIETKPDVLNMSFALGEHNERIEQQLNQLDKSGVICIAAYSDKFKWPHSYSSVISVGTKNRDDCNIITIDSWYQSQSIATPDTFRGSSAACAIVSGIAACAKAWDRLMSRHQFLDYLLHDQSS